MIRPKVWCLVLQALAGAAAAAPPNVILIMTDDQGYGDLGVHGNPIVRTPHLDAMAERSARWEYFYVSPVCTPTRASLMTGRYNYRTRAIDTFRGRALMDPDERTLAELLRKAGYATGIFGKWHLGDCYPLRPVDQGFDMALVHRGGGIGQPSDPPGGEGKYTDPILFRNGKPEQQRGYCTDVCFNEGMKWADRQIADRKPFFLYLPTNCPHSPYHDVPADKLAYYQSQTISAERFPKTDGHPVPTELNVDQLRRVYAMIENIDDNVGRLFRWLDERRLTNDTLVLFITDNGPATVGWNAGLRSRKSDVFDGGIRSPAFFHYPGRFPAGLRQGRIAAHIDLVPTVLELCGIVPPQDLMLDGRSLLEALETGVADWPERTLVFQTHRGDVPFARHHCAVRSERWKLVHSSGFGKESFDGEPKWMLFDMAADPFERHDLAADHPELVRQLAERYDAWFADVSRTRPDNYAPPRIIVGADAENPTVLTRQDWRGADWQSNDQGHWLIDVAQPKRFEIRLRFRSAPAEGTAHLRWNDATVSTRIPAGATEATFGDVSWPAGPLTLTAWTAVEGEKTAGVMFVEILRR
jgi:arylsulfatase/arylsulfatase A